MTHSDKRPKSTPSNKAHHSSSSKDKKPEPKSLVKHDPVKDVSPGRVRIAPNVREVYGTMGQIFIDRLYSSISHYNSKHKDLITLNLLASTTDVLHLRCDKLTSVTFTLIFAEYCKRHLDQDEFDFYDIKEHKVKGLSDKHKHYCFKLQEKVYRKQLPQALNLPRADIKKMAVATVDRLRWLSSKSNIVYLNDYFGSTNKDFNPHQYKHEVEKTPGFRVTLPYEIETSHISRDSALKDVEAAITGIPGLTDNRPLPLDCSLAIELANVMGCIDVFGAETLWTMLHASDSKHREQQRIRINFRSPNLTTWVPSNYYGPSGNWDWHVGDLVYVQGPRYAFAFRPTSEVSGFNVLCSSTNPPKFLGFRSKPADNKDGSIEEYKQLMMSAYAKPLSHRDVFDIWEKKETRPSKLCAEGKAPITWREAWDSLKEANGKENMAKAQKAAVRECGKGGYYAHRVSTPEINIPPQYQGQYVGVTMVQRMYPDNVSFC